MTSTKRANTVTDDTQPLVPADIAWLNMHLFLMRNGDLLENDYDNLRSPYHALAKDVYAALEAIRDRKYTEAERGQVMATIGKWRKARGL